MEAIYGSWSHFVPIQKGMPQDCSHDFERIVDYADGLIAAGNSANFNELKAMFRLEGLSHDDEHPLIPYVHHLRL